MIHCNNIAFTMSIDERCSLKTVFKFECYMFVGIKCLNKQIEFTREGMLCIDDTVQACRCEF